MNIIFKNIDDEYIKSRPEYMGDIQPKYWFRNKGGNTILVKRKSSQTVNGQHKKSSMYNHFGEYFGYLIARNG